MEKPYFISPYYAVPQALYFTSTTEAIGVAYFILTPQNWDIKLSRSFQGYHDI